MDVLQRKTGNLQKQFTQIFEGNPPLHLYSMHLGYEPTLIDELNTLWRLMRQKNRTYLFMLQWPEEK